MIMGGLFIVVGQVCAYNTCSQLCVEKKQGVFSCLCAPGYSPSGPLKARTCLADGGPTHLLIASDNKLRRLSPVKVVHRFCALLSFFFFTNSTLQRSNEFTRFLCTRMLTLKKEKKSWRCVERTLHFDLLKSVQFIILLIIKNKNQSINNQHG